MKIGLLFLSAILYFPMCVIAADEVSADLRARCEKAILSCMLPAPCGSDQTAGSSCLINRCKFNVHYTSGGHGGPLDDNAIWAYRGGNPQSIFSGVPSIVDCGIRNFAIAKVGELIKDKQFGNGCIAVTIEKFTHLDDVRKEADFKLTNNCSTPQLYAVTMGRVSENPAIQPNFLGTQWSKSGSSSDHLPQVIWPEKPYPPQAPLGSVPRTGSFDTIGGKSTHTMKMFQQGEVEPWIYRVGSCEMYVKGRPQAAFRTGDMSNGFVCVPIPR
jgi:hypothetical protein